MTMQTGHQVKASSHTSLRKTRQPTGATPTQHERKAPVNDGQPENATRLSHSLGAISVLPLGPPVQPKRATGVVSRLTAFNSPSQDKPAAIPGLPANWTVRPPGQAKLTVGQPNDIYEQEADRVADQIMTRPDLAALPLQRTCACGGVAGADGECAACHAKRESLQRTATGQTEVVTASTIMYDRLGSPRQSRNAHESVHVVRSSEKPIVYRKGETSLDITVPEPNDTFAPRYKYPWQNPELRKTIYPYRDEELAFFLRTYMEVDLNDPSTPVTPVTVEELTNERASLEAKLKDYKVEIKEAKKVNDTAKVIELSAKMHKLENDLAYLPMPQKGHIKGADKKWTAYRYSKKDDTGADLDHDALLGRILDRFDADATFKRYPKWLRYMVIHFSGMRYQSAHGSYAPANDLLKRLKCEQITFEMSAAPESKIAEHSEAAISNLEDELAASKKPGTKRSSVIKSRLTALHAVERERGAAFSKKGETTKRTAFEELMKLEDERDKLNAELDLKKTTEPAIGAAKQKRLEEIEPLIKVHEAEIGSKALNQVRKRLNDAEDKRRKAVIEYEIEQADEEFSKLDDMQALSVIKTMRAKGVFPEWVWREIVRVTALKLEEEEGSNWETVTAEEKKGKSLTDSATKKWKQIMSAWKEDVTGWREKHGNDLSLVVIRAVCNEICEMSLHARGVKPQGGINQKAHWYATRGSGASFSRPTHESDLQPGASLFFLEWSNTSPKDTVNIVRSDLGVALKSENNEVIADGVKGKDDWTYHFNSNKTVTRTRPIETPVNPFITPHQETQHLNWTHEAMVVEVDSKNSRVITFETGPIGLQHRSLKKVLDQWRVYIGFAPSSKEPAGIDEHLKNILPGR